MKIQFVLTAYLPDVFGGAEIYTQNLAKDLQNRGHKVCVTTLDFVKERGYPTDEEYDGIMVHRLAFVRHFRPQPFYALQFYPEMYDEATDYLKQTRPDVVHVTNYWFISAFLFAAMHLGIPVVGTHVDFVWTCKRGNLLLPDYRPCEKWKTGHCRTCYDGMPEAQWSLVKHYRSRLLALLASGYSFHHCPSPLMATHIREFVKNTENIGVWVHGVPDDLPAARRPKTKCDKIRLGFIGRWNRIKGLEVLLQAMRLLNGRYPITLDLYGEQDVWNKDEYSKGLMKQVSQLSSVRVRDHFDPYQIADIHSNINCLVVPSICSENCPLTILEAMALGTPVICADGAGMTHLVESGKNGLIFRTGDPKDLADKITELASSLELRNRLSAGAKCLRTISQDSEAFERIYQKAQAPKDNAWQTESDSLIRTLRFADEVYHAELSTA